ncbi:MAG: hypothetical protein HS115_18975 [Spirochaetales bacterium]|nr:hypothetical protein [Spirochaetales bacterium]
MRFLAENDLDIDFLEINKEDQGAPGYARNLASPTILVDGEDIVPGYREGHACRIYKDENGELSGLPPESALRSAVLRRIAKD